jgi:hypothetical protein
MKYGRGHTKNSAKEPHQTEQLQPSNPRISPEGNNPEEF